MLIDNLSSVTNQQVSKDFTKLVNLFQEMCFWGMVPACIDFENNLLTGRLEEILQAKVDKYKMKNSPQEILSILSTPLELVFSQQEKIAFKKLAQKKQVSLKELEKHRQKYAWVDYGYLGPAHSLLYYKKRLAKFRKNRLGKGNGLKNVHLFQKKLSLRLHLNAEEKYTFSLARQFMYLKLYRKEIMYKAYYAFDNIFKEIRNRFNYAHRQLHYCLPEEIQDILKNKKVDKKEIKIRQTTPFIHAYLNEKNYFYYGAKVKNFLKHNLYMEKVDQSIQQVSGMAAYLGKVTGTVKIVNTVQDMSKVKSGDILVSIATSPNILPAMAKAAAFVTDAGGVTCHAAIEAREMKKPCIIGTKIATQVFKDGDKVEVGANNGIVRKI